MTESQHQERKVQRERRFQSVMLSLVVAGILWAIQTLANVDKGLAAIQPRIDAIEVQLSAMYRASDARRDRDELERRIADGAARDAVHEQRFERIESRVDALETARRGHP